MTSKVQGSSYIALEKFKSALLAIDFMNIPEEPTEEEVLPFQQLFSEYGSIFLESLQADLDTINAKIVNIGQSLFIPEDTDAQGATLCYLYTTLNIEGTNLPVAFKYLVFQNAITCCLYGNIPKPLIDELSTSQSALLQDLAAKYLKGGNIGLYTLLL